jgi:hypothetical protein
LEVEELSATPVTIRDGHFMRAIRQKKPDFGVYSESIRGTSLPWSSVINIEHSPLTSVLVNLETKNTVTGGLQPINRMPIVAKLSSKWDPEWWDINTDEMTGIGLAHQFDDYNGEAVFYTALAQLHYYMAHSGADYAGPIYGVLRTDKYLVPVKREGSRYGELHIGAAIP